MQPRLFFVFLFFISLSFKGNSQQFTPAKLLKLETHPTDNSKFIAKFYSKETLKLLEYWTMSSAVTDINSENFNELIKARQIWADGEYFEFYPNSKRKLEAKYVSGLRTGKVTGFYDTGETWYKGEIKGLPSGVLTFFYKNGNIQKTEKYERGKINGTSETFYPNGEKQAASNYENGMRHGRYKSFHANGELKRKAKFDKDSIISTNCYDNLGNPVDCNSFYIPPKFPNGFEALKTEIEKLDFSSNAGNSDTIEFRIILNVDTLGNAVYSSLFLNKNDSMVLISKIWVKNLPAFAPSLIDDFNAASQLSISFPVCGNKILWLGEPITSMSNYVIDFSNVNNFCWNWEFPNPNKTEIYFIVKDMPIFPGGEKALQAFIGNSIRYPIQAQKKKIEGKVYTTFVIDINGYPTDVRVTKKVHPLLDQEAIRVVKKMPRWKPGLLHGKPVRVSYTVPINFVLTNPKAQSLNQVR